MTDQDVHGDEPPGMFALLAALEETKHMRGTRAAVMHLQRLAFDNAEAHGFHDEPRTIGDMIALIHSEASEVLELSREPGLEAGATWYRERDGKPEGIPYELADIIIRVFDTAGSLGLSPQFFATCYAEKARFNETRPHRHGGKAL